MGSEVIRDIPEAGYYILPEGGRNNQLRGRGCPVSPRNHGLTVF